MRKPLKLLLGLVSLLPLIFLVTLAFWIVPSFLLSPERGVSQFGFTSDAVAPYAIGAVALLLVLIAIYTLLLLRREDVHPVEKAFVPVAILFTNGFVLPVVWWLYVWKGRSIASIRASRPA